MVYNIKIAYKWPMKERKLQRTRYRFSFVLPIRLESQKLHYLNMRLHSSATVKFISPFSNYIFPEKYMF